MHVSRRHESMSSFKALAALTVAAAAWPGVSLGDAKDVIVQNLPEIQKVQDVENTAASLHQENATDARSNTNLVFAEFDAVPDGFRFVIADVAGDISEFRTEGALPRVVQCELLVRDGEFGSIVARRSVQPSGPRPSLPGARGQVESFSEPVIMYAEPGQLPAVRCTFTTGGDTLRINAYLAGHLVPIE